MSDFKVQKFGERYKITDNDGNILDDAQGYGYRTAQGAIKAYYYKQHRKEFEENNRKIAEYLKSQPKILKFFKDNEWKFYVIHDPIEFTHKDLEKFLTEENIEAEFRPKDIFRILCEHKFWEGLKKLSL